MHLNSHIHNKYKQTKLMSTRQNKVGHEIKKFSGTYFSRKKIAYTNKKAVNFMYSWVYTLVKLPFPFLKLGTVNFCLLCLSYSMILLLLYNYYKHHNLNYCFSFRNTKLTSLVRRLGKLLKSSWGFTVASFIDKNWSQTLKEREKFRKLNIKII